MLGVIIAPENEIAVGVLEDRVARFYRETLTGGNITAAYQSVLAPDLKLFHCKEIMARSLATYIAKNCVGRGRRERRERMVTRMMDVKGIVQPRPEQPAICSPPAVSLTLPPGAEKPP